MEHNSTNNEQLIVQFLKFGQSLQNKLDHLFQEFDLTRQQYNVLRILRGADEHRLAVIQLRDRLIESQPDITRLIERMIKKNLLNKFRDNRDKRKFHIQLNKKGLEKCHFLDPIVQAWGTETFSCYSSHEKEQLTNLLNLLIPIEKETSHANH